ncbi:blue light receptor [Orbilia brochopaga]|uniref:Blue light receptor n=1 Tax=Orbilia brochopaga TaxID=3140254 RepID=A0AAV9VCM0_9PEZI
MDPNDMVTVDEMEDIYTLFPTEMQGAVMPTSQAMSGLRHPSIAGTTMEDVTATLGPVLDDNMDTAATLLAQNDMEDAIMEESMQEMRRQSMAGYPMAYNPFAGLADAQPALDLGLQPLTTTGLPMVTNTFESPLFISPQTTTAAPPGLLDMANFTEPLIMPPQLQTFDPALPPEVQSRQNSLVDVMDTTPVTLPPQIMPPVAAQAPQIPTTQSGRQTAPFNTMSIKMDTIYSTSGFDMVGVLMRVATRPNPKINIGAVDMSCAFVVCDVRKYDMPIVYCSATFERLTGYTKHEILGRNCRFLQSPTGDVERGAKRKYVDEESVRYLKQQCDEMDEAQVSLINYRKGGQPFMNLLTTIPITWDNTDIVYIVGFQVDLVDHPGSIMNKNRDGTIQINYQHREPPSYYLQPPPESRQQAPGTTICKEDVSRVLQSLGGVDTDMARRLWDKILLENTDDVVHVLSLKGLFMYCSPSIRSVLEYDPSELVGTALSSVCHPSDIVPVTRDLKDTSTGSMVNIVFRIRRKYTGYVWFESHGSLHIEQGKGRKCIILVGRERPVYKLPWKEVHASGGIGENEMWSKVSISGMFLYVPSNSKTLLDRDPDELIGTSIQALMRQESRPELNKALDTTRSGKRMTVKHELQNRRGQYLQAITTFYPDVGDQRRKPTFVIAQTRLIKHTRNSANSGRSTVSDSGSATPKNPTPAWSVASSSLDRTAAQGPADDRPAVPDNSNAPRAGDSEDQEENLFDELKTTRSSSWQFELRQMQKTNKKLTEECATLIQMKKRRKRKKGADALEKDCANCHTKNTPEWRRGPSGKRDLCNSCGLRYAKLMGRVSPRNTQGSNSNIGEVQTVADTNTISVTSNPDGPSPRTEAPISRTNSGAEQAITAAASTAASTEQPTPASEQPTPGDAQKEAATAPPASTTPPAPAVSTAPSETTVPAASATK